jgi:hypothetical protein
MTEQPNEVPAAEPPYAQPRDYVTIVDVPQELFEKSTPEQLAEYGAKVWLERVDNLGYVPIFEPIEGTAETSVHLKMNLRSPQLEEHYLHVAGPVSGLAARLHPEP